MGLYYLLSKQNYLFIRVSQYFCEISFLCSWIILGFEGIYFWVKQSLSHRHLILLLSMHHPLNCQMQVKRALPILKCVGEAEWGSLLETGKTGLPML